MFSIGQTTSSKHVAQSRTHISQKTLQPNKRTKTSKFIKPKRKRRAVNVKEGKTLIEECYSEKYLQPHDISLKSTKKNWKMLANVVLYLRIAKRFEII